jgi:biotin carboxylase
MHRVQIKSALASQPRVVAASRPMIARYSSRSSEHEEQIQTLKRQLAALRIKSFSNRTEYQCAAFAKEQCKNWENSIVEKMCTARFCRCERRMDEALQEVKEADTTVHYYEELLDKHQKNNK